MLLELTEFSAVTGHFKKAQYETFLILAGNQILGFEEKALLYVDSAAAVNKDRHVISCLKRARRSISFDRHVAVEVRIG